MKKKQAQTQNEDGYILFVVMGILLMTMMYGAAVMTYASGHAYTVNNVRKAVKAKAYAEAGINHAYSILKTNFDAKDNAGNFPLTAIGDGTYDATVTTINANRAQISSVGTFQGKTVEVVVDVQNFGDPVGSPDPTEPWAYSIFAENYIRHNGTSEVDGGVHCNGYILANGNLNWGAPIYVQSVDYVRFNGGGSSVDGTVRSPSITGSGAKGITDPQVGAVDVIPFPVMDLTDYYNTALANGQVYSGGSYSGDWGTIPGGIAWFDGDVTLQGFTYEGCVIATGSITFSGGVNQTRLGMLPAAISRDSYIRFNGSRDIYGLLYAAGYIRFNGSGTLSGTAISGDYILFNGSSGVISFLYSEPGDVDDDPADPDDEVAITAWQK